MKKLLSLLLLLIPLFVMGNSSYQDEDYGLVYVDPVTMGLSADSTKHLAGGTLIGSITSMDVFIACPDDFYSWGALGQDIFYYPYYYFNGRGVSVENGIFGQTNPKDKNNKSPSNSLTVPETGCAFSMKANKDGYMYVWGVFSTAKAYSLFEDSIAVGYRIAMITNGWHREGYNSILDHDRVYLQYGEWHKPLTRRTPDISYMITGDSLNQVNVYGEGVMVFPVRAGSTYIMLGSGCKFMFGGVHFSEEMESTIQLGDASAPTFTLLSKNDTPEFYEEAASPEPYVVLSDNDTKLTFFYDDQRIIRGGTSISEYTSGGGAGGDSDKGTVNNPFNIAEAIAYIDGGGTDDVYVAGVISKVQSQYSAKYGDAIFWISDDGNFNDDPLKDFEAYAVLWLGNQSWNEGMGEVAVGDKVVLCGQLTKYNTTYETAAKKAYLYSLNGNTGDTSGTPQGTGTEADPFNVAAVVAKCKEAGETPTTESYYIKGITTAEYTVDSYKNVTVDIVDTEGATEKFTVYRVKDKDGKGIKEGYKIPKGATIIVYGPVVNYKGNTPETATGAYLVSVNGQAPEIDDGTGGGGSGGGGGETPTSLTNGNFETWANDLPTGWKSASSASSATLTQSTDAHSGSYSCNVNGKEASNVRLASQEIKLAAGTYNFSFWVKATTSDAAQARPGYVPVKDGAVGSYTYGDYATLSTSWQQVSYDFTLEAETTVCLIVMNPKKSNYSSGKDILVDDATLTKKDTQQNGVKNRSSIIPSRSESITTVEFDDSFANCTTLVSTADWFSGFTNLTTINGIGNLRTDNVTSMNYMFLGCSGLTTLDLSHFNTEKVTDMSLMFTDCPRLTTIYVGNEWSTDAVTNGSEMFMGCTSLVGGSGTVYDENHVDHNYAHIDGGSSNPGYFTEKNAKVWSVIGTINGDWDTDTEMTSADGVNFTASFPYLATGNYEFKIRANGSWDENYGEGGEPGGRNILVAVPEDNTGVVIWFNAQTKEITDNLILPVYTVPGSFNNWILDGDAMVKGNDGIYALTIDNIPAGGASWRTDGAHEYKIAVNHSWDVNYGADGVLAGNNLSFNLPEGENSVTIYFDPVTHIAGTDNPQVSEQVATPTFSWTEDVLTMSTETENATISYTLADGYYLIGGNGEWSSDMSQKFAHTPGEPIYTYVLKGNGTDLWFAFGDAAALNAIDNGDWNQLFGASVDGGEMSGTYDRRYNLNGDHSFHVDGLAPFYRFSINTIDKTYLIEPLDSEPSFIPESNSVNTYTGPIEIKSDVFITAIAKKDGMKDSKPATMDYPYSAWKNLLDAESKGETAVAESASNDKVPESLLNELKHLLDEAQHLYIERTAERATIEDMTVRILSLVNDITEITSLVPYAVLSENNTKLTFYYDDQKEARGGMSVGPFNGTSARGWHENRDNIITVVFNETFAECHSLTSTRYWFYDMTRLENIVGIQHLKTENVTQMQQMFPNCSSLKTLDLSGFNTENVTEMHNMFYGCSSLSSLNLSTFNTSKVTHMGWMFQNCTNLRTLNISGFNTSLVRNTENIFADCSSLASIQAGNANIPAEEYAKVNNPNLLVYVNEARLAPSNVQNVVINGMAREIVLTDTQDGNNDWYAPQAFVAERISYTRNFAQSTSKGTSRGWESIALPFDVQTIQHESKGVIAPFNSSASNKHFWLRRLTENGLQAATSIEANTPYIISMPNSEEYTADYNLNGRVTFSAQNIDVPATKTKVLALADSSIVMVPAMQRQSRSSAVWALNVGEVRGQYFEGSVFERDYRTVRPFEAYTIHRQENGQPAPRYVPIQEIAGVTGIETIDREPLTLNQWYDMQGRKLEGKPARKGVYISNGKKVVVK